MASAAAPTANLLQTCAALLMSPYCGMHSPNIEAVLVKIGLQSTRIGLKLIDILLRNCAASGTDPASESDSLQPLGGGRGTSESHRRPTQPAAFKCQSRGSGRLVGL